MTTNVVDRTSFHEGLVTRFVSCFTFRKNSTILCNERVFSFAASAGNFSFCSSKRHASFWDQPRITSAMGIRAPDEVPCFNAMSLEKERGRCAGRTDGRSG
jgi:hypothetical protein